MGSTVGQSAVDADLNAERAALLGSAYKRRAVRQARKLLKGGMSAADEIVTRSALDNALARSGAAYRQSARSGSDPLYGELHELMLVAARNDTLEEKARCKAIGAAKCCIRQADEAAGKSPDNVRSLVMPCDGRLVLALLEGRLEQDEPAGTDLLDELTAAYAQALRSPVVKRSDLDSIAKHVRIMADFVDALGLARPEDPQPALLASRLDLLARSINESLAPRRQRTRAAATPTAAALKDLKPKKPMKPPK